MKRGKNVRKYMDYIIITALLAALALASTAVTGCGRDAGEGKDAGTGGNAGAGEEAGADGKVKAGENAGADGSAGAEENAGADGDAGAGGDAVGNGENGMEGQGGKTGLAYETARDGHVDFAVLQEENPDVFAWLYVPGTGIDAPVLQSPVSDDYYKSHRADGEEGEEGALYTEMPNMMDMCDFNTVIHGKDGEDGGLFAGLHKFEDPDFFGGNEKFYIYLPDNVLTYEVFAAYYDGGSDILRRFDYTTYAGCAAYLEQVYGARGMGKNQREGWDDLTPYHFLVTLDGGVRGGTGKRYVVVGALVGDAAGQIDRVILD